MCFFRHTNRSSRHLQRASYFGEKRRGANCTILTILKRRPPLGQGEGQWRLAFPFLERGKREWTLGSPLLVHEDWVGLASVYIVSRYVWFS
jgi:hypothetical protein